VLLQDVDGNVEVEAPTVSGDVSERVNRVPVVVEEN